MIDPTGPATTTQHTVAPEVDEEISSTLDVLDDAVNYMGWIVDLMAPYLEGPVLEVGAGHGTFTGRLASFGQVHALEPGPSTSRVLAERFADDARITVERLLVDELPTEPRFASAVMINVLEHIDDDAAVLRQLHDRLVPGGHLAIWVPAFDLLYSDFDRRLGHHRRYRRSGLVELVERTGWRVVDARYVNLPGWFSWLIVTRLARMTPSSGPMVRAFDRVLVPLTRAVESRVRVPFGQSAFVVARKPLDPDDRARPRGAEIAESV